MGWKSFSKLWPGVSPYCPNTKRPQVPYTPTALGWTQDGHILTPGWPKNGHLRTMALPRIRIKGVPSQALTSSICLDHVFD